MSTIRVVLADDHTLVRAGIRALLDELPGIKVIAEASDGVEAVSKAEAHRPDVILMDIGMPNLSGLEATERVTRDYPEVKVLIVSMHKDEAYVRRALLAGAAGYLLKDSDAQELGLALRAVSRGESYLSPAVSTHLVAEVRRRAAAPDTGLTRRQIEVVSLIAKGQTTKAIARSLGISAKTVEAHRAQLMERLQIRDVASLVRFAIRSGLVDPED